jgi:type II secretory pathway pseudopilin PulG
LKKKLLTFWRCIIILKYNKGFTLIETIVSLSLFFIVIATVSNILIHSFNTFYKVSVKQELLANATIAMEFISTRIITADEILLITHPNSNTVKELHLERREVGRNGTIVLNTDIFTYSKGLDASHIRFNRIDFGATGTADTRGRNELASHIADFTITIVDNILEITIISDDRINQAGERVVEPIVLYRKIKIYKPYTKE